jgi:hypothetical protein
MSEEYWEKMMELDDTDEDYEDEREKHIMNHEDRWER